MNKLKQFIKSRRGDLATAAVGVAIILIVGIISALIFFNISAQVPHTDNATNETISTFTTYAKLAFGFIGLGAFVGAAFLIISILRGTAYM